MAARIVRCHQPRHRTRTAGGAGWRHGLRMLKVTAFVLLVVGYPSALVVLARLKAVLVQRRVWWFAALEGATASIGIGWLLRGRPLPALINGIALVGFAIAWSITGRRALA